MESAPELFQLSVTNVEATVMGKIWMCSDCRIRKEIKSLQCTEEETAIFALRLPEMALSLVRPNRERKLTDRPHCLHTLLFSFWLTVLDLKQTNTRVDESA